jgi:hypothetical protein
MACTLQLHLSCSGQVIPAQEVWCPDGSRCLECSRGVATAELQCRGQQDGIHSFQLITRHCSALISTMGVCWAVCMVPSSCFICGLRQLKLEVALLPLLQHGVPCAAVVQLLCRFLLVAVICVLLSRSHPEFLCVLLHIASYWFASFASSFTSLCRMARAASCSQVDCSTAFQSS